MNIPAISSLVVAAGGKAALPGLGDILSESGLPLDFAALLAGQIPLADPTVPAATIAETILDSRQVDTDLLSGILPQVSRPAENSTRSSDGKQTVSAPEVEESAAAILAALSASPKQTAPALAPSTKQSAAAVSMTESEKDGKQGSEKDGDDEKAMAAIDAGVVPTDTSLLAQFAPPLAAQALQAAQNRVPDGTNLEPPAPQVQITSTNRSLTPGKESRSALPDQANTMASESPTPPSRLALTATQATPAAEARITARPETANAAILAADPNAGNSGNPSTFATALAATGMANANAAPAAQPAEQPRVATAFNAPNWSQDFGSRVVWLAKNDQQVAQININPPQLGPVQISISMNGDQVTAAFASPYPEVRHAIQESLSQLREMFSTAGISLGQANVGTQLPSQNRESAFQFANEARSTGENAILSPDSHASSTPAGNPIQRGRGLVDLFA